MIEVQNLSFAYGSRPILQNVSFSLEQGECVAVLGNNGAGKSTLISCISRLRRPSSGSVLIDGTPVTQMTRGQQAQQISYVAQKNELAHTTVFDAVLLGRKPHMKWGPHIVRRFVGSDYRFLLPCSALAGSTLLLLGDLAAKVILPPAILPIGAITSLLGAPLFLLLIFRGEALR